MRSSSGRLFSCGPAAPLATDCARGDPGRGQSHEPRCDAGVALLITMLLLFILSLLSLTFVTLGEADIGVSSNYRSSISALYLSESGLDATIVDLQQDPPANPLDNWVTQWIDTSMSPPAPYNPFPDVAGSEINGAVLTAATLGSNPYPGTPYNVGNTVDLGSGSFSRLIWLPPSVTPTGANGTSFRVEVRTRSLGSDTSAAAPSEVTLDALVAVELRNSSPWNNAMFLGSGQTGQLVNGLLQAAGSVHVIGDAASPPTLYFPYGSSQINNYNGIDSPTSGFGTLASKIPGVGSLEFNGETVSSLDAVFRLKDANLELGSYGTLGQADVGGNGTKETLDAVYSDDPVAPAGGGGGGGFGFGGGSSAGAYADTIGGYDFDSSMTFPGLASPYTDPDTGVAYSSYADWLTDNAYRLFGGDLVIDNNTSSFAYSDSFGKGSIAWDPGSNTLTVSGIIKVSGHFELARGKGGSALNEILYQGTGVIYATQNVKIHLDVYPVGQYLEDGPDADTAIDGNLGLIAGHNIDIAYDKGDPNVRIMAALFAQNKIRVHKLINIAGGLVTNFLDIHDDALRIWQVPRLALLAPHGMPPGQPSSVAAGSISNWYQRR